MERQDLNGYRKPQDVVQAFDLSKIELNSEDIEKIKQDIICDDHLSTTSKAPVQNKVVTNALNNKVTKETGKGLSSNDFTDEEKLILDEITTEEINQWNSGTKEWTQLTLTGNQNVTPPLTAKEIMIYTILNDETYIFLGHLILRDGVTYFCDISQECTSLSHVYNIVINYTRTSRIHELYINVATKDGVDIKADTTVYIEYR